MWKVTKALHLIVAKRFDRARELLAEVLEEDGKNVTALAAVFYLDAEEGAYLEAVQTLERVRTERSRAGFGWFFNTSLRDKASSLERQYKRDLNIHHMIYFLGCVMLLGSRRGVRKAKEVLLGHLSEVREPRLRGELEKLLKKL